MVKPLLAFFGVCSLSAFIAWAGGYNFDHRGEAVGEALYFILIVAAAAAAVTHTVCKK